MGERAVIGAGSVVGQGASSATTADSRPRWWSSAHDCIVGARDLIGVVIGGDGFGMADATGLLDQGAGHARAIVGDDVEIGANTTVDRGALGDTVIEDGVKMDNLIQIAHNVVIGAHTAIAACAGIAGSARIGRHCKIGGAPMI